MTAQSKAVIKSYFEAGDKPTAEEFGDLVDSYQDASNSLSSVSSVVSAATSAQVISTNGAGVIQLLTGAQLRTVVDAPGLGSNNVYTGTNTFQSASSFQSTTAFQGTAAFTGRSSFGALLSVSGAAVNFAAAVSVSATATCNIFGAASNAINIPGLQTIFAFDGDVGTGVRYCTALEGFSIAQSTRITTPTSATVVCAPGDTFAVYSSGTNPVRIRSFQRADGTPLYSAGRLLNIQYITSTQVYTPTTGTNSVLVQLWGAGASGARSADANVRCAGAAGAFAQKRLTTGFSGVTVTIGAGGATVTANNTAGNAGGASAFGALITCNGGTAGSNTNDTRVAGGTATGGDINIAGGSGSCISGTTATQSIGGITPMFGAQATSTSNGALVDSGIGYGNGGASSPAGTNSGAGAPGLCIIYEYS